MKQKLHGLRAGVVAGLTVVLSATALAGAQDNEHWRKYKPLPPNAHIVVTVEKGFNGKPMANAAVVFHAVRDGKNDGNLQVKTDQDGKATIDVIEIGSQVTVQVIATGYATTATDINVDGPSKTLLVKLQRPRAQISDFEDNDGKASQVKPGVQVHTEPKPAAPPAGTTAGAQPAPAAAPAPPDSPR